MDGHLDVAGVLRWAVLRSPVHVAVHRVALSGPPEPYSRPHRHDEGELNVILPSAGELVYEIGVGKETSTVQGPAAVWIPPGEEHSANGIEGSGYFICIRVREPG